MRGADEQPGSMFSDVSFEERVPADHPLRAVRRITDQALKLLSPRFGAMHRLIVQTRVTPADGHGEGDAALVMVQALAGDHRVTVAGDKATIRAIS